MKNDLLAKQLLTPEFNGTAGNDFIHIAGDGLVAPGGYSDNTNATAGADTIDISQGGNDSVYSGAGNDEVFVGASLTAADHLDGGTDNQADFDTLYLDGDYTGGNALTFAGNVVNFEFVRLAAGHSYTITVDDAFGDNSRNQVIVDGGSLASGYSLIFDGSAETTSGFVVSGGDGNDQLTGGGGNDDLFASWGDDVLTGNGGNDTFFSGGPGTKILDGGAGSDTVSFSGGVSGIVVDLSNASPQDIGPFHSINTFISIENIFGTFGDDTLTGDGNDNVLNGSGGNDTLNGGSGSDTASYDQSYAVVVDLTLSGAAQDTIGAGLDTLNSIENLYGSNDADTLKGDAGDNVLNGSGGDDILQGRGGNDTLIGGLGSDTASYADGASGVTVDLTIATAQAVGGGLGNDTLSGIENLIGSAFADTLTGDGGNNTFTGGAGDDVLSGAGGTDTASYADAASGVTVDLTIATAQAVGGGLGSDTLSGIENLTGSAYADTLTGDAGNNVLSGGAGNDILVGGLGDDTLDGGADIDTASYADAASGVSVDLSQVTRQITGGAGNDYLFNIENLIGSAFADALNGSSGNNTISGGAGDDSILGLGGTDILNGGDGSDAIIDAGSGSTLDGGNDIDRLRLDRPSLSQAVTFTFTPGSSTPVALVDGTTLKNFESLNLTTGSGNDAVTFNGPIHTSFGVNLWNAGAGTDTVTVDMSASAGAISASLNGSTYTVSDAGGALVNATNVENFHVIGGSAADTLSGGTGADTLSGMGGDDTLTGGSGAANTLQGGTGNDTYIVSASGDQIVEAAGEGTDLVQTTLSSFTLAANVENLTHTGGGGFTGIGNGDANILTGSTGADYLIGLGGADTLIGGTGAANTLQGGTGDDTYVVSVAGDSIIEAAGEGTDTVQTTLSAYTLQANVENLTYTGSSSFTGTGNTSANVIVGGSSADTLIGGDGAANTLQGGLGDDTYIATAAGDAIVESAGQGTDLVKTNLAVFSLAANVENLTYTGAGAFTGIGNGDANTITGGVGADYLIGQGGADTLIGGSGAANTLQGGTGDDIYVVSVASDSVLEFGGEGFDTVQTALNAYTLSANVEKLMFTGSGSFQGTGNADANTIIGGASADLLDGGTGGGANTLQGGQGDDTYIARVAGDQIVELAGQGTDTVQTALSSFVLAANVENLLYTGAGAFTGIGNGDANTITGGSGADYLIGQGGADTLIGGSGSANTLQGGTGDDTYIASASGDSVIEFAGEGYDVVQTGLSTFNLSANVEKLVYTGTGAFTGLGNSDANVIIGGTGSDYLIGLGGDDVLLGGAGGANALQGGTGNDIYAIEAVGDSVIESAGEGFDQVQTNLGSFTLSANVEELIYTGAGDFTGMGNGGDNILVGGAHNDTLTGGLGNDTLSGGAGDDRFVFTKGDGLDTVTDFTHASNDIIDLHGYGIANFAALQPLMSQAGADTLIAFDAQNHILLQNVTMSQLDSGDFTFS